MSTERTERWRVGNVTVTAVVEAETMGIPPFFFFPDATADEVKEHPWAHEATYTGDDGSVGLRVQAFVVEAGGRTVLVDPCVGNGKKRAMPFWNEQSWPWFERFTAAGFSPEAVDIVVHTHLHPDHVGWDTVPGGCCGGGGWVPVFERARHLYVGAELEFWRAAERRVAEDMYADSIAPVIDAGLADIVEPDADLGGGLRLVPAPGHTPGQVAVSIVASDGSNERAVISGDLVHHPVQCSRPDWREVADWDVELARATRRAFFEEHAASGALVFGTHFPSRPAGRIVIDDDAWRFVPVDGEGVAMPAS